MIQGKKMKLCAFKFILYMSPLLQQTVDFLCWSHKRNYMAFISENGQVRATDFKNVPNFENENRAAEKLNTDSFKQT